MDGVNLQGPGLQKWQFHRMPAGLASISMLRATRITAAPHSLQWEVSPAWMSSFCSSTWTTSPRMTGMGSAGSVSRASCYMPSLWFPFRFFRPTTSPLASVLW